MKRIALLAVIGAGMMALPSTAAAQSGADNCPVAGNVNAGSVTVGVSAGQLCVHESTTTAGGELVVNNSDGCTYINGWDSMPAHSAGYAGLCVGAGPSAPCPGSSGSAANTGGCFVVRHPVSGATIVAISGNPVTDMFICGNTSGPDPQNAGRDGCSIP